MNKFLTLVYVIFCSTYVTETIGQVGDPAPDFIVTDIHGNKHELYKDYLDQGKKVVLDFFFTTCTPCIYYTPQVTKAYEKYGCNMHDVIFLSIDFDDTTAEVLDYEKTYNTENPTVSGKNGGGNSVVNQYQIQAFPTLLLIDSTKKIIDVMNPPTLVVFDYKFAQYGISPKSCITSTQNRELKNSIVIFPNPICNDQLNLQLNDVKDKPYQISITDITGNEIKKYSKLLANGSAVQLDISDIFSGTYILKLNSSLEAPVVSKFTVFK